MTVGAPSYKGCRFPAEIISNGVWLYHRFPLSFREVEEMMLARGIIVSHETVWQWCEVRADLRQWTTPAPGSPGGNVVPG